MGRSPCCDKVGLKKGPWTSEEDQKLLAFIDQHGHGSWRALPGKAGLERCGKSCRLRWTNYLRPDIKRGKFSLQEEQSIIQLHALLGNRWSAIATHLPKRTDNEIKNHWNTHLKKRLTKMGIDPVTHKAKTDALSSIDGQSKNAANLSHMAQWESARLEAEARLARQSKILFTLSNSAQGRCSEFACSSNQYRDPFGSRLCLDVLKRGKGDFWARTGEDAGASGGASMIRIDGDLDSPTSTMCSAARTDESPTALAESLRTSLAWCGGGMGTEKSNKFQSAGGGNSGERLTDGNFVENLSKLVQSGSSTELPRFSEHGGEPRDEDKNYWNSILHMVNSSPSHSPIFECL